MKFSYWTIVTLVLLVSVSHYQAVFAVYEHNTVIGQSIAWAMGVIFEAGFLLFLYHFTRIESGWKHLIMIIWIAFIYFFQYEYYSTIAEFYRRMIYAGVWPFMLVALAFIGNRMRKPGTYESDIDRMIAGLDNSSNSNMTLGFLAARPKVKQEEKEEQSKEAITGSKAKQKPESKKQTTKSKTKGLFEFDGEWYTCPGCGEKARSYQQLNGAGHNVRRCIEENKK